MNDLDRMRNEYEDRKRRFADRDVYSRFNAANLFTLQQRERSILSALAKNGSTDLSALSILEMGCGAGSALTEFLNFGASPPNLHGMDILADRLIQARERLPASHFVNADGQRIPFPSHSFDIVMQYTAFSSVLDETIKREIAKDMLRVLKPNGLILWYDFWLNPTNPQTRGIRPKEIRALFPKCKIELRKITLAPPITRKVAPISWLLAGLLENIKIFNSHYLGIITPRPSGNL